MVTSFVYFEMQNNLICTRNHFETKILKIRDIKYRYKDFPEIGVLWSISETLYIGKVVISVIRLSLIELYHHG